jgi:transposase
MKPSTSFGQGWTFSAIAHQVGLDRTTVREYVQAATIPEHQPRRRRARLLDPFKPYLLQRWNAGCHTGVVLLREIENRGYQGGASICLAYITQLRKASSLPPQKRSGALPQTVTDPVQRTPSTRRLIWLVLRRAETLDDVDGQHLSRPCDSHTDIATAVRLAQEFASIVRQRGSKQLDRWLEHTEQSRIAPLVSSAKGISRDYAAVRSGVTLEFSNDATEGHINRLKRVKRQMFGRAKLDLLKRRFMAA